MEYFELNNHVSIPAIGSGTNTFGRDVSDLKARPTGNFTMMTAAIQAGYRFFDSAISYGNEEGIGKCIRESGIPRKEFFVLSKIPNRAPYNTSPESIAQSVEESLEKTGLGYYDLFLIHQAVDYNSPDGKMNVEVTSALFRELQKLYLRGKFQAVGVANFNPEQLQILMDRTGFVPAVDQFRSNPAQRNFETIRFCKENGILPMAHSPMNFTAGAFQVDEERKAAYIPLASAIGEKYGKTWGQVSLRFNYQLGMCSIPKSHTPARQKENLAVFDFALTPEEMDALR